MNTIELDNGGCTEWDETDGTIRYIDCDGNCEDIWRPGDEEYERHKATYFPNHVIPEDENEG